MLKFTHTVFSFACVLVVRDALNGHMGTADVTKV